MSLNDLDVWVGKELLPSIQLVLSTCYLPILWFALLPR